MNGIKKITYLDGMRGLAALFVVFSHVFYWFNPYLHVGSSANKNPSELSQWLFNSPITFFYRGTSAVWLFFVLSGFVLTYSIYKKKDSIEALRKAAQKRYFRLGFPVLFSIAVSLALIYSGAISRVEGYSETSFQNAYAFTPDIFNALYDALIGSMLFGSSKYNYVLWTISIEFYGSLLVFGAIALFGSSKRSLQLFCIIVFSICIFSTTRHYTSMAMFAWGMLIATIGAKQNHSLPAGVVSLLLALCGLYLFGYTPESRSYSSLVEFAYLVKDLTGYALNWPDLYPQLGAIALISCVAICPNIFFWLGSSVFEWLGKISFSVYLLHSMLLAAIAPVISMHFSGTTAMLVCLAATICATLISAHFFYIHVDRRFTEIVNSFFANRNESKAKDLLSGQATIQ